MSIRLVLVLLILLAVPGMLVAAPCLTNPSDQVGNPVFGATVQTFINFGINPNVTCIENGLWANPSGFKLGSYIKGAEGFGYAYDPTVLGAYNGAGSIPFNANGLDNYWVQDTSPALNPTINGGPPSTGNIWDLGGQANQAVVFVMVDHGPVPQEVLENTAWLSNNPNALDIGWTQASLTHVYGAGWEADPAISDGFVAVYTLPNAQTFQYVSVTWGGPGSINQDGDDEIDAVGGLTAGGTGVVPEPSSLVLLGSGLASLLFFQRRRSVD